MRYEWAILAALSFSVAIAEEQNTAIVKTGEPAERFAKAAEKPKDAAVVTKSAEEKREVFVLPDMGWRDPFVDSRDAMRSSAEGNVIQETVVGEPGTILQKALDALTVESIIGLDVDGNLSAVIGGAMVRAGDTVTGESLKFNVDRITKDSVYLRCLTEDEKLERLHNFIVKKKLGN